MNQEPEESQTHGIVGVDKRKHPTCVAGMMTVADAAVADTVILTDRSAPDNSGIRAVS